MKLPLLISLCLVSQSFADLIWIEGEDAASETMLQHGWYDSVKKGELSGGEWLSHFGDGDMPVAEFEVEAAASGKRTLWLRANPVGAALSVRLNGGDWQKVDLSKNEQNTNIAADGKPDLRFVAWVNAGEVTLKKGANALSVRFESGNNLHGGLDCLVLSDEPFLPQGSRRPGQKTGKADAGTWAFEPDRDTFSPESLLDLSGLNEKPAGKIGWVARSKDGADFVDGGGEPLRFWAVNTGVQFREDMAAVEEHARWLAKRGVNMVRHHGHLPPGKGSKLTDVNQKDIDAAWRLVAAMKEQGIYVTLSPYWASHTKPEPSWGLASADNDSLTGLIFFDKQLQAAYKGWLRALLTGKNPHTGIPLAQDPTLAIFQIQNEDSLLFWTEQSIKGAQREALGRQFGDWLVKKYGSLEKAAVAWGRPARSVLPEPIWNLTQPQDGKRRVQLADQLAFYTGLMRDFNAEIARFLKEDLGYKGLVNAGNWRTADQAKLLDAERYAYAVNDVIGVNRYFSGGEHKNPSQKERAGYLISQGDVFSGESALKQPWAFPLAVRQVKGHPMIISESAWVPPLRYQSEGPFLVAAYGALTGFDIFYWFATSDIGFGDPMGKWQLSTPAQIGMFPAAALMFRQGYVKQGAPVLVEGRSVDAVTSLEAPILPEEAGFDPNRDTNPAATEAEAATQGKLSPLSYLAGGVEVDFAGGKTALTDLTAYIDGKSVRSVTGELVWNYADGICTLDAPKVQGVTGDLAAAGKVELGDLAIVSKNEYASVLVVSMDGVELAKSKQILIQVGTTARPHGWKTEAAGDGARRIVELGSSPWNIENAEIQMLLKNSAVTKATQLDANGIAVREVVVEKTAGGLRIVLPEDVMYLLLR
jgi:hypothetical protein